MTILFRDLLTFQEICGCHDPLLMDASIETDYQNKTFCPILRSDSKRKCASEATANFGKDGSVDCNCQPECDSLKYEVFKLLSEK